MNTEHPRDLPDDIAALLAAERHAPDPPSATRDAVLASVKATVAGSATSGAISLTVAWKGLAVLVLATAAGVGVWRSARPDVHALAPPPVVRPVLARAEPVPPVVIRAPLVSARVESPDVQAPPVSATAIVLEHPHTLRVAADASASDDLGAERALLDGARHALATHNGTAALYMLDEHARQYPHGRLGEEREAMAVQALVLSGGRAAAESRAERFRRRYPNSVFAPAVEQSLDESRP